MGGATWQPKVGSSVKGPHGQLLSRRAQLRTARKHGPRRPAEPPAPGKVSYKGREMVCRGPGLHWNRQDCDTAVLNLTF